MCVCCVDICYICIYVIYIYICKKRLNENLKKKMRPNRRSNIYRT